MRIIFIGSENFADKILGSLVASEHELVAIVTCAPPKDADDNLTAKTESRGNVASARVFDMETLSRTDAFDVLASAHADVAVAAGKVRNISAQLLNALPEKVLYVHPSALPEWRGPNPVPHTILYGGDKTAVSIIQLDESVFEGPIYAQTEVAIDKQTAGELEEELAMRGGELLLEILPNLSDLQPQPQGELLPHMHYAHMFLEEDMRIDFRIPDEGIIRMIRAFSPFPGAFFDYEGERIRILQAISTGEQFPDAPPGTFTDYSITTAEGSIMATLLRRDGHEAKCLEDLILGFPLFRGDNVQHPRFYQ